MANRKYIYTLIAIAYVCSVFLAVSADEACDKSKCKGPVKYYEDVNCTPIYSTEDTCCAVKYNCDHLHGRSKDKCYYKRKVYEIGEAIKAEDASPCDIGCHCSPGYAENPAHFSCAVVDCFSRPEPGCYLKNSHNNCCPGPQVCLGFPQQNDTGIPRCEVDGKVYLDGQRFTPESDPTLSCICGEGYTGENIAPFCKHPEPYTCKTELRHAVEIYQKCIPAFYSSENPATDCSIFFRCHNEDDRVVEATSVAAAKVPDSDSDDTCVFGPLKMKIGDQLNQATYYSSVCLKCECEVPPLATCKRLPDDECDITVHPKFDDFSK